MNVEMDDLLTVSDLAKAFGVLPSTLRYWEDLGMLQSKRDVVDTNDYRYYIGSDIARVSTVMALKEAGVKPLEIKGLIEDPLHHNIDLDKFYTKAYAVNRTLNLLKTIKGAFEEKYEVYELELPETYTIAKSKWVDSIDEAIDYYNKALIDVAKEGYSFTYVYPPFCQYPLNDPKDLRFQRRKFLMRVFIPIAKKSSEKIGQDFFSDWYAFTTELPTYFLDDRTDFVHFTAEKAICVIYRGQPDKTEKAYEALREYANANDLELYGQPHEIYLSLERVETSEDPLVSRITVPVLIKSAVKKNEKSQKA
jgi:DNA-binding transcriptional MerR regulator/effector-binding domain-containing protein